MHLNIMADLKSLSSKYNIWSSLGIIMQNRNRLTDFENNLVVTKGERRWGGGVLEVWDWHMHTVVYGIVGQQEPAVYHKELYPIFCDDLYGKRVSKKNGCVYMYN